MKKHALLLTAYNDFKFLKELCTVYGKYFKVYIHIDRKVNFAKKDIDSLNEISRAAKYVLTYNEQNPQYMREIKYCFVGEEFFFQNIFMNSPWKDNVKNNHLIFDIWSPKRGIPDELNVNDYEAIMNSEAFFARKVSGENKELWDKIRASEGF